MRLFAMALVATVSWGASLPRAGAEGVHFFELEGFARFLDGSPESTAITEDGALSLPPEVTQRFCDPAMAFAAVCGQQGRVIAARVGDGQIMSIDAKGRGHDIFRVPQSLVTALLCRADGSIVVAASSAGHAPRARLYLIDSVGRIDALSPPRADYVWAMAEGAGGRIIMATGAPGAVVQSNAAGNTETLWTSEQAHLKAVAVDPNLGIVVGGGERGIVYQGGSGKPFSALYDTGTTEVTALVLRDPFVFAVGVSGSVTTVASEAGDGGAALGNAAGASKKSRANEVRSQLVRIGPDKTVDVLAGSGDEAVFAMAFDARGQLLVATGATGRDDPRGRLYSINPDDRSIAMVHQSPSRRLTHLVAMPGHKLALIANGGARVLDLGGRLSRAGTFVSQPFDTGVTSSFGLAQVLGAMPAGTSVSASVRTGQTAEPDEAWSPWSQDVGTPTGGGPADAAATPRSTLAGAAAASRAASASGRVDVPPGRFLQVRLRLTGNGARTPLVYRMRLAYLRQNVAPFVREVRALRPGLALTSLPRDDARTKIVNLGDKSDEGVGPEPSSGHASPRARQVQDPGSLTVRWAADDANGDALRYSVFVRPVHRPEWRQLADDLEDCFYTLRSAQLADGHYIFRVRASDRRSNPDGLDKADTKESRAVLIDNTAPVLSPPDVAVRGRNARITGAVQDNFGPLTALTYALDGQLARPIAPDDGLLDGPVETYCIDLRDLGPGHHTVVIAAVDDVDNQAVVAAGVEVEP